MKKAIAVLLLFLAVFAALPTTSYAQDAKFTNYVDIVQLGVLTDPASTDLEPLSGILLGYHFTTLELGRLNTLGFGVGWTLTNKPAYSHTKYAGNDLAVTTSQSIRLTDNGSTEDNVYFNFTYGYNLVNQMHGIYFGFSFGGK